jgi:hypothetical protein
VPFALTADPEAIAYPSVADAESADEIRGGGTAFLALDDEVQAQLLASASLDLDTSDWKGDRATTTQELEWPRTGTIYSDDAWPGVLIQATIALAFANAITLTADAAADLLNPALNNIKREKTGPLEVEFFSPVSTDATDVSRWPTIVQALIARLIRAESVSEWGLSARTVRGS